jgi:hypothetical protein
MSQRRAQLATVVFTVAGCERSPQSSIDCQTAAIVGGSPHAEFLALDVRQEAAVCQLQLKNDQNRDIGVCTGVLIGPRLVITARHCFGITPARTHVRFLSGTGDQLILSAGTVEQHPELDVALVALDTPPPDSIAKPLAIVPAVAPPLLGSPVQIGGFGSSSLTPRRFAVSRVTDVSQTFMRVSADGRAAACFGDSGGPALIRRADGQAAIAGILSAGSSNCAASDEFTRLDAVGSWLDDKLVDEPTFAPLGECELLGPEGRCYSNVAIWCEQGRPFVQPCTAPSSCGFSSKANAFRCVDPDTDPCEGVSQLGRCENGGTLRCVGGELQYQPCGACGATCVISAQTGYAICNAQDPTSGSTAGG